MTNETSMTEDELQELAFKEAHDNPFTDEQLLEAISTESAYISTGAIKTPEDYEAAAWDSERNPE